MRLGVYVLDPRDGVAVAHQAAQPWYLASMVKVPVALAVLQGVERGEFSLDDRLTLHATDYVDGAGSTNGYPPGHRLRVRFLMEQMLIHSDNTATDMLIRLVGVDRVNALAYELASGGVGRITTLADVRRAIYAEIAPAARTLGGQDFLRIRASGGDAQRVQALLSLVGTPAQAEPLPTLPEAYSTYYASSLNAGRLDAFAGIFAALEMGQVLAPAQREWLLQVMARTRTGDRRIKAGLPGNVIFAHKTGTQRARFCDGGIVRQAGEPTRALIVVACVAGDASQGRSEHVLRGVGEAVAASGYFD